MPPALTDVTLTEFKNQLPQFNDWFEENILASFKNARRLSYTGRIDILNKTIQIGIEDIPPNDPLSRASGSENMVIFTTLRYAEQPLIISGPGAGAAVTASGIAADLLRLASTLST